MRLSYLILLLATLALPACISLGSSPQPASTTTVVVPPGSTTVCSNGAAPPC